MEHPHPQRLRPPPRERFADDFTTFDLVRTFEALDREESVSTDGHRQITLFKRGPFTLMALSFEADASWPRHLTDGVVTLELIRGHLDIFTSEGRHTLLDRGLSVIQPRVALSIHAPRPSHLLMGVYLEPED
ncbi:hypothetical protein EA187_16355 [Lujinxingia sediminis]|uniref:AraC family transcriptional regulator n=1 Tax=Lujinxingia sediminis TaxID=2480984 RepID=A0ABY0CPP5_9DELT|nr:hypothetical protein [Lujinxingia sediminis]RVU42448.1 hypothetical protein EA187_16355 [Lujinxingia sediminis]